MAQALKTTFKPIKVLQSFYTGGKVALSQDGRILASTIDEDVLLTDMESGAELARIEGDTELITTLAITPKATHVITCSRSFNMRIYALQRDEPLTSITATLVRTLKAHEAPIITCTIDPSGSLLATGGSEGLVKVWDIKGGYVTHSFRGHGGVISALSFFTDSDNAKNWRLASAADDTRIMIWDLYSKKSLKVLESHNSVVRGLDWSIDGNLLVSAGRDQIINIWETSKWKLRGTIPAVETLEVAGFLKPGAIVGQEPGDKSQVVFSGGERGIIRLWSSTSGKEIEYAKQDPEDEINDIIYNKDLSQLIAIHNDQTLLIHNVVNELPILRRLSGHHDEIIDIQYVNEDSSLLAVATNSEDIRLVTVDENSFGDIGVLKGHSDIAICLDTDRTGQWLTSGSKDNEARLWKIDYTNQDPASRFTCKAKFAGHAESIGAVALSRTSAAQEYPKFLITGSRDCTVKRWDIQFPADGSTSTILTPRAIFTRKAHDKDINSIDVSPDDSLFASASQDRVIKVWSAETGEVLGIMRGHRRGVWSVRFGPMSITASNAGMQGAGRLLVSGSGDKTVRLWDLSNYTCIKTFEGHAGVVLRCIWLTGGLQVASAGGEGLVKAWDIRTGECSATLDNHEDKVWGLVARKDDQVVVSAGADSVITFWQDVSEETREAEAKEAEHLVEQEQKLSNFIHTSDYRSAIELALELNHPQRLFHLFASVAARSPPEPDSISGIVAVDDVLADLADEQLFKLLTRIRDWNTNSKNAAIAQRVLSVILKRYSAEKLIALANSPTARRAKKNGSSGSLNLKNIFDAMGRYTERHYSRVEELLGESYLVDYTLKEIEESAFLDGKLTNGVATEIEI